jgi:hypothetical protein
MMDLPHINKKKPFTTLHLTRCSIRIQKITLENWMVFDADQNISDLNKNNNIVRMVYRQMDISSSAGAARWISGSRLLGYRPWHRLARRKFRCRQAVVSGIEKKGALRAPPTPTESLLAIARSHSHKTRLKYGYLLLAVF